MIFCQTVNMASLTDRKAKCNKIAKRATGKQLTGIKTEKKTSFNLVVIIWRARWSDMFAFESVKMKPSGVITFFSNLDLVAGLSGVASSPQTTNQGPPPPAW